MRKPGISTMYFRAGCLLIKVGGCRSIKRSMKVNETGVMVPRGDFMNKKRHYDGRDAR